MMSRKTGILNVGTYNSRCWDCSRSADPHERTHKTVPAAREGDGCGVEFQYITSDYTGMDSHLRRLRPDLILLDMRRHLEEQIPLNTTPAQLVFQCRACTRQSYEFCDGGLCGHSAEFIEAWHEAVEKLSKQDDWNPQAVKELAEALLEDLVEWPL